MGIELHDVDDQAADVSRIRAKLARVRYQQIGSLASVVLAANVAVEHTRPLGIDSDQIRVDVAKVWLRELQPVGRWARFKFWFRMWWEVR